MQHEQVRAWIVSDESPGSDFSREAREHLAGCSDCRAFADRWADVRQALEARSVVTAAPGFRQRWFVRLAEARRRRHQRQMALALSTTVLGSLLTFGVMAWGLLRAPASVVGVLVTQLVSWDAAARIILDSLEIAVDALPPLAGLGLAMLGVAIGVGLILLYTGFSALWTASFYRAVLQTRTKEN